MRANETQLVPSNLNPTIWYYDGTHITWLSMSDSDVAQPTLSFFHFINTSKETLVINLHLFLCLQFILIAFST